uniref:Uncharacterized protein n=1 Tax=Cacopsylla melanoneura TaxID=428564 RepID=A0A8D8TW77_9HEMI
MFLLEQPHDMNESLQRLAVVDRGRDSTRNETTRETPSYQSESPRVLANDNSNPINIKVFKTLNPISQTSKDLFKTFQKTNSDLNKTSLDKKPIIVQNPLNL